MACGRILLVLSVCGVVGTGPLLAATRFRTVPLELVLLVIMPLAVAVFAWGRWYRLTDTPRPSAAMSPSLAVVLFLGMFLLGIAGGQVVRLLAGIAADEPLGLADRVLVTAGYTAGQIIVVAVYLVLSWRGPARDRAPASRAVLLGAGAFAIVWPVVVFAATAGGLVTRLVTGTPVDPIAHETLQVLTEAPPGTWSVLMGVLVVGVVPVLEEVTYRGLLQRALIGVGLGRWTAIVATSVVFALMHRGAAAWHALPAIFVLSIGFGWIYERTGRLSASVSMHILFNAVNLGLATLSGARG
jgi:membrane protease YdiL (CAAX protease family)